MIDERWTYQPDAVSPPGETLLDLLEERDLTQKELALRMGRPLKTINEIVKGKAAITKETSLELEKVLGTPADFWLRREARYREYLARVEEQKNAERWLPWLDRLPIRELMQHDALPKVRLAGENKKQVLLAALRFFGVASPEGWEKVYAEPQVSYRRTRTDQSDTGAIAAWLRLGEIQAERVKCDKYSRARFQKALETARSLTVLEPEEFEPKLNELCAQAGVALVLVPAIPRAHVSGVSRWLSTYKPLLQLSLYGKTNDRFWFTFFHEAAHILMHDKNEVFLDEFTGDVLQSRQEEEANAFAASFLIPEEFEEELPGLKSKQAVTDFARRLGIHPGIVVGRLQHDQHIPVTWMNELKTSFRWREEEER
jgi:HTH-type transcriptional regulator/antitoxin HigA